MTMVSCITNDIKISVQVTYEDTHSRPLMHYFVFSYRITIENKSDKPVRLLRRHWHIFDAMAGWSEVEGEGVVGQQPLLYSSEEYLYESFCPLISESGKMYGTYLMENINDHSTFLVNIPQFELIAPIKTN